MKTTIMEFIKSITRTASAIVRLYRLIWGRCWKSILVLLVLSEALVFLPFAASGAQALLINELLAHGGHGFRGRILFLLTAIVASSLALTVLASWRTMENRRLWIEVMEDMELRLMKKRSEIEVATYEDPHFHDLVGKIDEKGVFPVWSLVENQFQQLSDLTQMSMSAVVLLFFDWRYFILSAASVLPGFIVEVRYGKSSWDIWDQDAKSRRIYHAIRYHFMSLQGLIELSVFQNIKLFFNMAADMFKKLNTKQLRLDATAFRWRMIAGVISTCLQSIIFGLIVYFVCYGRLQIGTMTFLLMSVAKFQGALSGVFSNSARQYEWTLYATDVFKLFDTPPAIETTASVTVVSRDVTPCIEFINVSFAYPNTDRLVVRDINLTIPPGQRLAVVGLNGAGKSTLIKLLMRFYDPTRGRILINGTDLRTLDRDSWWSCIAVLFQHYAHYNFSVRDVISLGRSDEASCLGRVVRSANQVDAHRFILDLPHRYDQIVGKEFEGGVDLSWGQMQKLALSRAVFRRARVMILDEPTASIDAKGEALIFEQLERDKSGQTQIVISHRFSTTRRAHRICVLEHGAIVELGSHQELVTAGKAYEQLFKLQAHGYE